MESIAVTKKMSTDWANEYQATAESGEELVYPSETLIRLLKGDYITGKHIETRGKTILDVGFGEGNNTIFFASLGMNVSGVEIHDKICEQVSDKLQRRKLNADLRLGANQNIPFADNSFDFLVSWNVLHYEGSENGILAALKEYARVLKPNGRLLLSTTGPTHKILLNAKTLGNHQYEIGRSTDFRKGQVHFFFDAPNYIEYYFNPYFDDLKIGRIEDMLFNEKLDWWLVTGVKK